MGVVTPPRARHQQEELTEGAGAELALEGVLRAACPVLLGPVALPGIPEGRVHDGRQRQVADGGLDLPARRVDVETRSPGADVIAGACRRLRLRLIVGGPGVGERLGRRAVP